MTINHKSICKCHISKFSCHCIGACFNPYKDLTNSQTLSYCPRTTQPQVAPYIFFFPNLPIKKIVLTSI